MARLDIDIKVSGEHELEQLEKTAIRTDTGFSKLQSTIVTLDASFRLLSGAISLIRAPMEAMIKTGFEYNKSIEQNRGGIVALSVAMQDKAIPVMERYAYAQKEAMATLKELEKINAQTPHTLDQTNQIYKALYTSMKGIGASSAEMIELTRSLSIAAGAAGIEFNSLLAGVDGLATGTVLANSDLGRFLGSLGLSNKTLKESDNVVKLVAERLKDFKALDTMTEVTSNFDNAWSQLMGKMTENTFEGAKTGLKEISKLLSSISDDDLTKLQNGFNTLAIFGIKAAGAIIKAFGEIIVVLKGAATMIENAYLQAKYLITWNDELINQWEANRESYWQLSDAVENVDAWVNKMTSTLVANVKAGKESVKVREEEAESILNKKNPAIKQTTKSLKELEAIEKQRQKEAKAREKQIKDQAAAYREYSDALAQATMSAEELRMKEIGDKLSDLGAKGISQDKLQKLYEAEMKRNTETVEKNTEVIEKANENLSVVASTRWTEGLVDAFSDMPVDQIKSLDDIELGAFQRDALYKDAFAPEIFGISYADKQSMKQQAYFEMRAAAGNPVTSTNTMVSGREREFEAKKAKELYWLNQEISYLERKAKMNMATLALAERKLATDRAALAQAEEELRKQQSILAVVNAGLKQFASEIKSLIDGLSTDWYKQAKDTLFGGTQFGTTYEQAKKAAEEAWKLYQNDPLNQELLDDYNTRMNELMGTLDNFKDASKYNTKAEQEFAKHKALREMKDFQESQDIQRDDTQRLLNKLDEVIESTDQIDDTTKEGNSIVDRVRDASEKTLTSTDKVAASNADIENATKEVDAQVARVKSATDDVARKTDDVKRSADAVKSAQDAVKGINDLIRQKKTERAKVSRREWVQTGVNVSTKTVGYTVDTSTGKTEYLPIRENVVTPTFGYKTFEDTSLGFKQGGYTGDIGINQVAGVVHGQEYVVNAQTTQDLGLNADNGGVIKEIADLMYEQVKTTKKMHSLEKQMLELQKATA